MEKRPIVIRTCFEILDEQDRVWTLQFFINEGSKIHQVELYEGPTVVARLKCDNNGDYGEFDLSLIKDWFLKLRKIA